MDEIIGKRFGKLLVESLVCESGNMKKKIYKCKCDCGNYVNRPMYSLIKGYTMSCGCNSRDIYKNHIESMIGKTVGSLYVVDRNKDSIGSHNTLMDCKCLLCGKIIQVRLYDLEHPRSKNLMCRDCYLKGGFNHGKFKDLTGQKFGMLTVVKYCGSNGRESTWYTECDCGNKEIFSSSQLKALYPRCSNCMKHNKEYYQTHTVDYVPKKIISPFRIIDNSDNN